MDLYDHSSLPPSSHFPLSFSQLHQNRAGSVSPQAPPKVAHLQMVVQWLKLQIPNAGDLGLIPGLGTRSHMLQLKKKKKKSYMLQ